MIVYPAVGHEANDARIRGRVYDTKTGRILARSDFDDGSVIAMITQTRPMHPSRDTHAAEHVQWKHFDATSPMRQMTREEINAMFDRADAIRAKEE